MPFCTQCGVEIQEEINYCPECGTRMTSAKEEDIVPTKCCKQCGTLMPTDMLYCLNCGARFNNEDEDFNAVRTRITLTSSEISQGSQVLRNTTSVYPRKMAHVYNHEYSMQFGVWKNKWIALLFCIPFGWLGIHRFYEGKVITGFLYLCTLGILGIGWLVDIVRIACKPNPYRVKLRKTRC